MTQFPSIPWAAGPALVLIVFAAGLVAGLAGCEGPPADLSGMTVDSAFVAVIVPVLRDQCEECHFDGGPMYKKMPFDDFRTVSDLEDELTIRLEGSGRETVSRWLDMVRAERYGTGADGSGREETGVTSEAGSDDSGSVGAVPDSSGQP